MVQHIIKDEKLRQLIAVAAASIGGGVAVLSYLPDNSLFSAPLGLLLLFYMTWHTTSWRAAVGLGLIFGFSFFLAGLWWIYTALSGHVGFHPIAALLLTMLFCVVLASFPVLALVSAVLISLPGGLTRLLALSACWTFTEWLRSWVFTGFPWLGLGYSQIPGGWLAEWAPIAGILGIALMVTMMVTCLLALIFLPRRRLVALIITVVLIGGAPFINNIWQWVSPAGTLKISLLQGNVTQSLKWKKGEVNRALNDYLRLAESSEGRVIIMPETALPMVIEDLPAGYMDKLRAIANERFGAIVVGVFEQEEDNIYNSAVVLRNNTTESYRKVHLTPYGEYTPFANVLLPFFGAADIPYSALSPGNQAQSLPLLDGIRSAISICYEDIFGNELRRQLPDGLFLTNITNDAWFDETIMPYQHLQIARVRALESGRWLVRATNTGITAIINEKGQIVAQLPQKLRGVLTEEITLYRGATPYVLFGDTLVLWAIALILLGGISIRFYNLYKSKKETP